MSVTREGEEIEIVSKDNEIVLVSLRTLLIRLGVSIWRPPTIS